MERQLLCLQRSRAFQGLSSVLTVTQLQLSASLITDGKEVME